MNITLFTSQEISVETRVYVVQMLHVFQAFTMGYLVLAGVSGSKFILTIMFILRLCTIVCVGQTRAVLRLVWPFDGIVQKHMHKRLI